MSKFIICIFLFSLILASCGSVPPTFYYRLDYDINTTSSDASAIPVKLGITSLKSDLLYESEKIVYRDSPYEAKFYNYRKWIAPPRKMIGEKLYKEYKQSQRFERVEQLPSNHKVDYVLGGRLLAFENWDEAEKWYGSVAIKFELLDNESREIVWEQTFSEKTIARNREPSEVVIAINQSLNLVIEKSIEAAASYLSSQE
jgi:ABC-type uncharacterized transport system auxiliary subunit